MILASFKPPDALDLPDAFSFWIVRVMLLLAAALGAWLAFDTRRALKIVVAFAARRSHLGRRLSINPENAGWIWFYIELMALLFWQELFGCLLRIISRDEEVCGSQRELTN